MDDPEIEQLLFKKNLDILTSKTKEITFPKYKEYPQHLKEIFQYFEALMPKKTDLAEFAQGILFKESIINVYFKILEKINLLNFSFY